MICGQSKNTDTALRNPGFSRRKKCCFIFIVSLAGQPEDALHPIRACSERGDLMSDFELLYLLLQFALVVIGILSLYNKK